MELNLNVDDMTIGDVADVEEVTGRSLEELFAEGQPKGRAMQALVWVTKRRDDPEFTFEDAGKLKFSVLANVGGAEDVDPS